MAQLKKQALGQLKGKVGNIVGRDFGYDHYISLRPTKYKVKKKLEEVSSKLCFQTLVLFAKNIVKYPEFKKVWDECEMPGKRGYNKIITANYKLLKDNRPTTDNIITPKGRELILDMLEVNNKGIRYTYNMAGLIKPRLSIIFIILFFNPKMKAGKLIYVIRNIRYVEIEYADRAMDKKGENYIAEYCFNNTIINIREKYNNAILYTAVVGTSAIKNKKWWTNTVAIDISSFKLKYLFLPGNKKPQQNERGIKISKLKNSYKKQLG